jgi:hypothetical protein
MTHALLTPLALMGAAWSARGTCSGKSTEAGVASWKQMSKSSPRRFPVTVSQLPVTRCEICHRTVAYQPGSLSEVLTEHYRRAHPEVLGVPTR